MIKKITISDFKSIRNITVDMSDVTVLIGRSGSGKSNFVQAIRFLRNFILDQENAIEIEGGWSRIVPIGVKRPEPRIRMKFEVNKKVYTYLLRFGLQQDKDYQPGNKMNPITLLEEYLTVSAEKIYHRLYTQKGFEWITPPATVNYPQAGVFALNQLPAMGEVVRAYTALSNGLGYYHFPTDVMGRIQGATSGSQQSIFQCLSGLHDNAANYLEMMKSITQNLHNPEIKSKMLQAMQQINPVIQSMELDSLPTPQKIVIAHQAGDKLLDISLNQESDGLRRFYAHLLALYQMPAKLVNIFEEPENAIFPGALSLLADEFNQAPADHRGQVILTTHSPTLLDHFDIDKIRVVEFRDGQTQVGPVSKDQYEAVKENLLSPGELLTVDPARLDEDSVEAIKE